MKFTQKKHSLAIAVAIVSTTQSQAAVSAITAFDGKTTSVTLNFTEGVYTPTNSKNEALLAWNTSGLDLDIDSIFSTSIRNESLTFSSTSTEGFSFTSGNVSSIGSGSKASTTLSLNFDNTTGNSIGVNGGSVSFDLPGEVSFGPTPLVLNLINGDFSGTDNSLTINSVPEPSSILSLLAASSFFLLRRR